MKRLLTACVLATVICLPASAGPLKKNWVSAKAQWVAHIDVDAARASSIGKFFIEHRDEFDIDFDEMEEMGIDPIEDIDSVTLYGVGDPEKEGVIIVQMNDSIDRLIEKAKEHADDFEEIEVDGVKMYSIDDGEHFVLVHKGRSGRRTVIITGATDRLIHAVNVIEGDARSLDDADSPALNGSPRKGAICYAQAAGLPWLPDNGDPASHVVKLAKQITFQVGEYQEEAFATLALKTSNEDDASNINAILNGVIGLGRMVASQKDSDIAELNQLLDAVKISSRGNGIKISVSFAAKELLEHAQMLMEQHEDEDDDEDEDDEDDEDEDDDWDN